MELEGIFAAMSYGPSRESADEATRWLKSHKNSFDLFIGGEWKASTAKERFDSHDPATGTKLASLAKANAKDIDLAVKAARKAQGAWAKLGGHGRARYLYALARLVQKHSRLFAVLETLDNGKPIRESRDIDIPLVARHFYHHAGWAQLLDEEFPNHRSLGVVGQVIPWNFPLLMLAWKVAPALAAGNTVVLKPAEDTSLTALLFAEIAQEAGLPAGVLNIVTGAGETGAALVDHPDIDKIAFTGSTEVGRLIRQRTAGSGKKLTLELGGKSPFIVFDDADLDSAVEGIVDGIWFNQGQVCCAGSRLLVQEGVYATMVEKLRRRMETLRVGDPLDKSTDIGALVSPTQLKRVTSMVEAGLAAGGKLWQPACELPGKGSFYPPSLISDVAPASPLAQQEIFGPVLVAMSFRTPDEAVQLANNTVYGLAASVWSESVNLTLDIAPKIKAGVVWINCTNQFDAACGFGGYRESGYGREGGREGMLEYLASPSDLDRVRRKPVATTKAKKAAEVREGLPEIDRTLKLYIGGKQARPDGGYSRAIHGANGKLLAEVSEGNRKDIRNAVEAAVKNDAWTKMTGHARAQVLYFVAENLAQRRDEFAAELRAMTGVTERQAAAEVDAAVTRLFSYAAWADKYDGTVHNPPLNGVAIAMNEPIGVIAMACPDEAPLLAFVSMLAPALALGNRVVIVPSQAHPLSAARFYQVLDTSDMPAGAVNIVTGERDVLVKTLADHPNVGSLWYEGGAEGSKMVELASAHDLKQSWVNHGLARDWTVASAQGRDFLRRASQVKNIWVPYGE
ncbi:MAG TPA: aldehyde dehydrogenase family protein [Dongiaceae bacterium]|nr:aldehyde dehydrogenase family protein [Dongiaceae bacterium]